MTNENFFYCYNPQLKNYLRIEKGIPFLCHGLSVKDRAPFWQFEKTDFLQYCLKEYEKRKEIRSTNAVQI